MENDKKSWWPATAETFLKQKYNALLQSLLDDPGPLTNGELRERIKKDFINSKAVNSLSGVKEWDLIFKH